MEVTPTGSYTNASQGVFLAFVPSEVTPTNLAPCLTIARREDGSCLIGGDGSPGRTYTILSSETPQEGPWQPLGLATADPNGFFLFLDPAGPEQRFYRTLNP